MATSTRVPSRSSGYESPRLPGTLAPEALAMCRRRSPHASGPAVNKSVSPTLTARRLTMAS